MPGATVNGIDRIAGTGDEMPIDVLARRARMTTRAVRAYRTLGLLPAPRLVGRVGFYDSDHLARLEDIGRLVRRGYPLAVIRELLTAFEDGRTIRDLLDSRSPVARGRNRRTGG
jgi:DNA-binding transcriptional MerR regulator